MKNERNRKIRQYKCDCDTHLSRRSWNSPQEPGKEIGRASGQRKNQGHPDHSPVKFGWNTKKSSADPRRHAVAETSVKIPPDNPHTLFFWRGVVTSTGYFAARQLLLSCYKRDAVNTHRAMIGSYVLNSHIFMISRGRGLDIRNIER